MVSSNLFGIINVNKPTGFTSHDVVGKLRKILKTRQIGHTGTLDPMATGVLPICVGKATKIIQYLDTSKAYRAFIRLGIKTNTYDAEGEILEVNSVKDLSSQELMNALNKFTGEISQKPPIFSAVHYKGKRLYEYARANIEVADIPERKVCINSINLIEIQDENTANPVLVVDIECSGGTYIRSIAYDLGEILGYGASLDKLIRTKSGKFTLDQSKTLDEIEEAFQHNKINELLINPADVLELKKINLDQDQVQRIQQGQFIKICDEILQFNVEKLQLIYENKLIAIAKIKDDKAFPTNVLI